MEPRLSIITLGVNNLVSARAFYEKGLGWHVSSASNENIVFIQLGGVVLALYSWEKLAEDSMISSQGSGFRGITLAHNVSTKEEVVRILALAEKAGAKIIKPAQNVFWGGYSGYFSDPNGHLWEIAWNPYAQFNEKNELIMP